MNETKTSHDNQTASDSAITVDVIVLSVVTCGEDLSLRLLDVGLEVVGIEASLVGGECAYWACSTWPSTPRSPLAELRSMIYAFPTFYSGIGEVLGAYGRGLSTLIDPSYRGFEVLDGIMPAN